MSLSTERLQALFQVKLNALVRQQWGDTRAGAPFPGGAALLGDGGTTAWVLAGDASTRSLGGALAWALRRGATELHLLVETDPSTAGVLSRRAAAFAFPVTVWRVVGRDLLATDPVPLFPPSRLPAEAVPWADVLRAHGAEPVVEHGVLTGEVLGLEVARVVVDDAGAHLEVGVGSQDRRAQRLLRPDQPVTEALAEAVRAVRQWRTPGAPSHPAATLAAERWLRAAIVARPDLVDAAYLAPVPTPLPRRDLRHSSAAPAAGTDRDDRPVLVVCSTGIDLDLVPTAADARLADGRTGVRLVLAVPPGDDHPVTRQLAAALSQPGHVVVVPAEWRTFAPVA